MPRSPFWANGKRDAVGRQYPHHRRPFIAGVIIDKLQGRLRRHADSRYFLTGCCPNLQVPAQKQLWEGRVMKNESRRDFLIATGAVAVTGAISKDGWTRRAFAQKPASIAGSKWEYRTTNELVEALQTRKISAVELAEHVIARIDALDPRLNAVVVRDFDRARDGAKAADAALARGERQPLLGIPMVVKESFNVAGLPTTWGIPTSKNWTAKEDAVTVARLKAAGALILGKTNVPIVLGDWQSYNDIYGTTNNPWDLGRTPGGSSGGSAAALAAGFGSLSLGSDIGGSLRAPAHYCGVYAHKPTIGLVPLRGQTRPGAPPLPRESDLAVAGPMARSAVDLALALDVIAGPDEARGGIAYRLALPAARHEELKSFRVLVVDTHPLLPTAATVRTAFDRLSQRLVKAGVKVEHESSLLPDLADSARLYMRLLLPVFSAGWPPDQYKQAQAAAEALKPDDKSLVAERSRGAVLSHRDWIAADTARAKLQQQWSELFREWDVVLCPPMPTPAFPHDHSMPYSARHIEIDGKEYPYFDQLVWPEIATTPGLPATAAPIDRSETGLPIGVQIVGPYLEDRTTIAFAELMEREFGGFVPPPDYAG
jgi:amidase